MEYFYICENGFQGTTSGQLQLYVRAESESKLMYIDFFSTMKSRTFNQSVEVINFIALSTKTKGNINTLIWYFLARNSGLC